MSLVTITGKTAQTDQRTVYQPAAQNCACGKCSVFTPEAQCNLTNGIRDWQLGKVSCCGGFCTAQPVCASPSSANCDIGNSSTNQTPLLNVEWNGYPPNILCHFDASKIDTPAQIQKFMSKFGEDDSLLDYYCTRQVGTCPNEWSSCSRLKSIGEDGNVCRQWFETQPFGIQDSTIQDYCLKHNSNDCKCVNRSKQPSYIQLKRSQSINDGCWYVPCADSANYLVPTHLQNPTCPNQICQTVIDVAEANSVNIDNIKSDIVCGSNAPPSQPLKEKPSTIFGDNYNLVLWVGIITIVIVLLYVI